MLTLLGRDASRFAQAQTMNDVAALAPGHWQWNGWLTPKGRVVVLFALLKLDEETLWLLVFDADPLALAEHWRRLLFRSKLTIAAAPDLHVSGSLEAARWCSGAHFVGDAATGLELDMGGDGGGRCLRIASVAPGCAAGFDEAWAAADLLHGLPRLPPAQSGQWTPQQLSLDRLQAYSVRKGCYPGQEIVARTHFLGQAKRGLALLEADTELADDAAPVDDGGATVHLVSIANADSVHRALAVLPADAGQDLQWAGRPLRRVPMLGGLAR